MKRTRTYLYLLLLLTSVFYTLPVYSQSSQYALYNYRNDGDFNAWLNLDIDSITYSCIDTLGVEHEDIVVQEVWTPDSLYRIPMEAIDSIGFRAPAPEYKENVFHIREYHMPYILQAEGLTLSFRKEINNDSIPVVGQILISDVIEEPLPRGFSGRVVSIESSSDAYVITCEAVALTDIFERLILVGRSESFIPEEMQKTRSSVDDSDWDGVIPFEVGKLSLNIPSVEGFVSNSKSDMTLGTISITPKFCVSYIADIRPFVHSYVKVFFENKSKVTTEMHLKVSGESSLTETKKARVYFTKVPIPLVTGILYGEVAVSGDLYLKGDIDLKATFTKNLYNGDEYEWSTSDFWNINHTRYEKDPKKTRKGDDDDDNQWQSDVSLSVNGSFGFGASLDLVLFAVSENTLEISNTTTVGPELSGSLKFSSDGLKDGTLYSTLKDTNVTFTSMKVSDEVKFNICMREFTLGSFSISSGTKKFKLFPDFEPLAIPKYGTHGDYSNLPLGLYTIVTNDIIPIIPLKLGIGRYDQDDNLIDERFATDFYQYEDEWDNRLLYYDMSSLSTGETYTFHPLIRVWGLKALQLKAMPQTIISIPPALSLSSSSLKLAKGITQEVSIYDGWGDFEVLSSNESVASANIVTHNHPDGSISKGVEIRTKAAGNTEIRVVDQRSRMEASVLVEVSEEIKTLQLSSTSLALSVGKDGSVEITSGTGNYTAESSDTDVVTVEVSGSEIKVTAIKAGTATITVTDTETSQTASVEVTVKEDIIDIPADAIDLGLPSGTKWASYNVGATKPEDFGGYYAWGETEEKSEYSAVTYKYCDGTEDTCHDMGESICGTNYDVAHVRWGGKWQMPSHSQFEELISNCTQETTTLNGIKGVRFTGSNGNSIFLPAAGEHYGTESEGENDYGDYFSGTQYTELSYAYGFYFGYEGWGYEKRWNGHSVRPVYIDDYKQDDEQDNVEIFTVNGVSFKMVKVEGGTFMMGAADDDSDARDDEKPQHQVTLSSFSIGETEVTQELWEAVMGSNPSNFEGAQRPVEQVSWDDCQDFISKLNALTGKQFRLPTEAEWEYAARGGNKSQGYKYSGSNTIEDVAWYRDNSEESTHDVKTKQANELGLYDMSGNVWEWCEDWYGDYSSSSQSNPTGPSTGSGRVERGGSRDYSAGFCRVSLRGSYSPGDRSRRSGLRLAISDEVVVKEDDSDDIESFTINGVSFKMVKVEGGTFMMGAADDDSDADNDEKPQHQVTLSSFSIGETEVTQELWEAVMGSNPSNFEGAQRPVEGVSWDDCQDFITKLNALTGKQFRLPTEAEWEYAARGGNMSKGYKYSGSNTIDDVAWYWANSEESTHDVKTKQANELGLYDMSGNVWEWCEDWYGDYSSSSQSDPTGPSTGSYRVGRGGGWSYSAGSCRVSSRHDYAPGAGRSDDGLRLAL